MFVNVFKLLFFVDSWQILDMLWYIAWIARPSANLVIDYLEPYSDIVKIWSANIENHRVTFLKIRTSFLNICSFLANTWWNFRAIRETRPD